MKRVALVIGNREYSAAPLKNAVNDATAVSEVLGEMGFEVLAGTDVTRRALRDLVDRFRGRLGPESLGFFYFAGHGIQLGGKNFLVPVSAEISDEADVEDECVRSGLILRKMEIARSRLNVVVLDACRNNPYGLGMRELAPGLAREDGSTGTLIAYATAPGKVASDAVESFNGLYAQHLLRYLGRREPDVEQVFQRTKTAVAEASRMQQVPYVTTSVVGRIFLASETVRKDGRATDVPGPTSPPPVDLVECPLCGRKNEERETFRCRECGEDNLCLGHLDEERFVCAQCVAKSEKRKKVLKAGDVWESPVLGMRFRYAPPGEFLMGSPEDEPERINDETQHRVRFTRGLWIAETAVTQGQYRELTGESPSRFEESDDLPVETVSWFDAVRFANLLSERAGYEACYRIGDGDEPWVEFMGLEKTGFRLPTEAEWEYSCRAGTTGPFWTGRNLTTDQGNYEGNYPYDGASEGEYRATAVPVRSFSPNPWGLFEVHGNVCEWCWDWFDDEISGSREDPIGLRSGLRRALRGGGWPSTAKYCRSALRYRDYPGNRNFDLGFRLVRTAP